MTPPRPPWFGRLSSAIGSQGLGLVLTTVVNLLSVPVLLHAWGPTRYGGWIAAAAAAALVGLLDCGLHGYLTGRIRHFWSRAEMAEAHRCFRMGLILYAGPMAAVATVAALCWMAELVPEPFPWLAAATMLSLPRGLVSGVLSADGRMALEFWLFQVATVGTGLAVMAAALWGADPTAAAVVHLAASLVLGWLPLAATIRRLYPGLSWRPVWPDWRHLPRLARHAPLFFLPRGSALLLLNGPVLLLARLSPPEAVVLFSMLRTFTGLARQLVQQCAVPFGIELARQRSREDGPHLRAVLRLSGWTLAAVAGMAAGGVLVLGGHFFRLWSAGQVAFAPWPAAFLLIAVVLTAPAGGALSALAHWHDPVPQAPGVAAQAAGGIAACALLIPPFGVSGAAFSLAAAEIAATSLLLWPAARRLMLGESAAPRRVPVLPAAALGFAAWSGIAAAIALWLVPARGMLEMAAVLAIWLALQMPLALVGWRRATWPS